MEELRNSISVQEQRVFLKFCVLLNYSATVAANLLEKALGSNALRGSAVKIWMKNFKEGKVESENIPKPGIEKSFSRLESKQKIQEILSRIKGVSVRELTSLLDISQTTIFRIIADDLGLVMKLGVWVPHTLTNSQKEYRCEISRLNLDWFKRRNDILNRFICLDEFYIPLQKPQCHYYVTKIEPGTSSESIKNEFPDPKILLMLGMDVRGVAFWKTYEESTILNPERYKLFLQEYIPKWSWQHHIPEPIILHENTRLHNTKLIQEFIESEGWIELRHPTYSPDMNPCMSCFNYLKLRLPGNPHSSKSELDSLIQNEFIFEFNKNGHFNGVNELPSVWQRIIDKDGDYLV